jgi:hypothetical protein
MKKALIFVCLVLAACAQPPTPSQDLQIIKTFTAPMGNGFPVTNVYVFDYKGCHVFVAAQSGAVAIAAGNCN